MKRKKELFWRKRNILGGSVLLSEMVTARNLDVEVKAGGENKSCGDCSSFSCLWSCSALSVSIVNSPSRDSGWIYLQLWRDAGLLLSSKKLCPVRYMLYLTQRCHKHIYRTQHSWQIKTVLADNSSAAKPCSSF